MGLSIDGRWRFAQGALNHWRVNVLTSQRAENEAFEMSPETVFLMSPEGIQGRPETPASLVTRASLR